MGIVTAFMIIVILVIDIPIGKEPIKSKISKGYYKAIKVFLIFTGILHIYVSMKNTSGFDSTEISGLVLFGLAIVYTSAGEHSGIEDKVARKTFKILTWFFIFILSIIHILL